MYRHTYMFGQRSRRLQTHVRLRQYVSRPPAAECRNPPALHACWLYADRPADVEGGEQCLPPGVEGAGLTDQLENLVYANSRKQSSRRRSAEVRTLHR